MTSYSNLICSGLCEKENSEALKIKASLGRMLEYERLERLSSQLSLLYILQIFAFKANILKISIDNISEQLNKTAILEKTKKIEETNKKIDKLIILLEAQYESMKDIGKNGKKDIPYVS